LGKGKKVKRTNSVYLHRERPNRIVEVDDEKVTIEGRNRVSIATASGVYSPVTEYFTETGI